LKLCRWGVLSIVPPVIAIALALITKEVVFSLLLGIMSGTLIYRIAAGGGIFGAVQVTTDLMITKVGENSSMVIFLAMLGALELIDTALQESVMEKCGFPPARAD
jgi:Na+/H+ antiporter NhaC